MAERRETSPQLDKELQAGVAIWDPSRIEPSRKPDSEKERELVVVEAEEEQEKEEEEEGAVWIDLESHWIPDANSSIVYSSDDEKGHGTSDRDAPEINIKLPENGDFIDTLTNEVLEPQGEGIAEMKATDTFKPFTPGFAEKVVTTRHGVRVRIYVADITKAEADAVVTNENPHSSDKSMVSRALCAVPGGQEFQEKRRRRRNTQGILTLGRVYSLPVKNKEFPFKYVLQAIITGYDSKISCKNWSRLLQHLYKNIYRKADEKDVRSVAVPLLGTGRGEGNTEVSVEAAAQTVCAYTPVSLEEVHFVTLDRDVSDYLAVICESCCDISNEPSLKSDDDDEDEDEEEEEEEITNPDVADLLARAPAAFLTQQPRLNQILSEATASTHREDEAGYNPGEGQDILHNHTECVDEETWSAGLTFSNTRRDTDDVDQEEEEEEGHLFETVIHDDLLQTGNQPPGTMSLTNLDNTHLPGYEGAGTIVITYQIPSGIQTDEHPHPGNRYHGVHRTAFLPGNEHGRMVTRMLKGAFERRLVFTVGRSRTTGEGDVVRWGPISHRTSQTGGADRYGYPDSEYLDIVTSELLNLGISDLALGGEDTATSELANLGISKPALDEES